MSASDAPEVQFIEVTQISIRDPQPGRLKGRYRVVIKHGHGTEEVFTSIEKGPNVTIDCRTFIKAEAEDTAPGAVVTTIEIQRTKQFRSEGIGTIDVGRFQSQGKHYDVPLIGKPGLTVMLAVGKSKSANEVARARYEETQAVLDRISRRMDGFAFAIGRIKLLVDLSVAVSEVEPHAKMSFAVMKMALEKVNRIPSAYMMLRQFAIDCIDCIPHYEDAKKVFKTERVRVLLDSLMDLTIKSLVAISEYYSKPLWRRFISSADQVQDLAQEMDKRKKEIPEVFMIEMREFQEQEAKDRRRHEQEENEERRKQRFEKEEEKLRELLRPNDSLHHGKAFCFRNTRISVLTRLLSWAQGDSFPELACLFWLFGVAGCGKSAVAASISQALKEAGRLAGSFFCKRDEEDRRNPVRLFGHIAYYLARIHPPFRQALLQSIEDPDLFVTKDLGTYFDYVLKSPLLKSKDETVAQPYTFVIDALDECDDSAAVARYLAQAFADVSWVKLIVTSRAQPHIRRAFADVSTQHDLYADDAREDIRIFFRKRLERAVSERELSRDDADCLLAREGPFINKADGLFIWIYTVIALIISAEWAREKLVDDILSQTSPAGVAEKMTAMYLTVLECACASDRSGKIEEIIRLIVGLLLVTASNRPLPISGLYAYIPPYLRRGSKLQEFAALVMKLSPVLKFTLIADGFAAGPDTQSPIAAPHRFLVQAYHATLLDFSGKKFIKCTGANSGEANQLFVRNKFWEDPVRLNRNMAMACLGIMARGTWSTECSFGEHSGLKFNICDLETSYRPNSEVPDLQVRIARKISSELLYSSLYWMKHLLNSSIDVGALESDAVCDWDVAKLPDMLSDLLETERSLFWLEVLSLNGNLAAAREILLNVLSQSKSPVFRGLTETASEMRLFLEQCFPAISTSAPHLYLSLTWIAAESKLTAVWERVLRRAQVLINPLHKRSQLLLSIPCPPSVDTFAVSPDGRHIASGSRDGYVRVWDLVSGTLMRSTYLIAPIPSDREHECDDSSSPSVRSTLPIDALAYKPHGSSILCVRVGSITELDAETFLPKKEPTPIPYDNVRCVAISRDCVHIALGCEDGGIFILDAKTYLVIRAIRGHVAPVDVVTFSPDGSRLAGYPNQGKRCRERAIGDQGLDL